MGRFWNHLILNWNVKDKCFQWAQRPRIENKIGEMWHFNEKAMQICSYIGKNESDLESEAHFYFVL